MITNAPHIIPPKTIVKLIKADSTTPSWINLEGKIYCVGYYSKQDGLDTIWLVDADGNYCETTDREYLLSFFSILKLGDTMDYFGENAPKIVGITDSEPYKVLEAASH